MSKLILERELHLIRKRLEAIEEALGEEMTADDEKALEEAMKEHRKSKTIASGRQRPPIHLAKISLIFLY